MKVRLWVADPDAVVVHVARLHRVGEYDRRRAAARAIVGGRHVIGGTAGVGQRESEHGIAHHLHRLADGDRDHDRLAETVGVRRGRARRHQHRRRGHHHVCDCGGRDGRRPAVDLVIRQVRLGDVGQDRRHRVVCPRDGAAVERNRVLGPGNPVRVPVAALSRPSRRGRTAAWWCPSPRTRTPSSGRRGRRRRSDRRSPSPARRRSSRTRCARARRRCPSSCAASRSP